jgi:hypothetical protein
MMFWKKGVAEPEIFTGPLMRCSFCNKSQRDVAKMVAGPTVNICSECVSICVSILEGEIRQGLPPEPSGEAVQRGEELISGNRAMRCALCSAIRPLAESVPVFKKGWLCRSCAVAASKGLQGTS